MEDEIAQRSPETKGNHNEERREALKKMGTFTAYTAPAMLALLTSQKTSAGVESV
ncbi:MAG: hypothetical protein ABW116_07010 [Candidatus Sedimenticola sp. 20ELBAFRAG]